MDYKNVYTFIWGHRGAMGYITENTMDSFELGFKMGADGLESDVHLTKDNKLVCFHDRLIPYNGIKTFINRLTLKQISEIDLDSEGRKIPTLEDVFTRFQKEKNKDDNPIRFSLDIFGTKTGLMTIDLARKLDIEERVELTFDDYKKFKKYRKISENIVLVDSAKINKWKELSGRIFSKNFIILKNLKIKALNIKAELITDEYISQIRKHGIKVYVWDCQDEPTIRKFLEKNVDGIYSNYPDLAVKFRQEVQGN